MKKYCRLFLGIHSHTASGHPSCRDAHVPSEGGYRKRPVRRLQAAFLTTALVATLASPLAYATDEGKAQVPHHAATSTAPTSPAEDMAPVDMKAYLQDMQATLLKMHDLSHKIQQTKNAKERGKLKDEHLRLMGQHMEMVSPLMMQMMMGTGSHGGDMEADEESADQAPAIESPPHKH